MEQRVISVAELLLLGSSFDGLDESTATVQVERRASERPLRRLGTAK